MSKERESNKTLLTAMAMILALLTVGTLLLQLYLANQQTTKLETALFGVLQFVFSLGFAWILSRVEAKREFVQSQRQFAIAAYRRINEIDEGVERVIARARNQIKTAAKETINELDVIVAIATGVRSSIKSSIADWGDVIGEEIIVMNKIEQLTEKQQEPVAAEIEELPLAIEPKEPDITMAETISKDDEVLKKLRESLPYSLQIIAQKGISKANTLKSIIASFEVQMFKKGYMELSGFYDAEFERDIRELKIGDKLIVAIDKTGKHNNAIIAKDIDGKTVGVIINVSNGSYDIFKKSLMKFMNKEEFTTEISDIETDVSAGGRFYFKTRALERERNLSSARPQGHRS